jgi:hypothetical protein
MQEFTGFFNEFLKLVKRGMQEQRADEKRSGK